MTAMDSRKLMKMDRLQLMELLQEITRDNERLTLRTAQLEEANAKLTLAAREAEFAQKEAQQETENLRASAPDISALPTGSFAEAMVQTFSIVEKTQKAADEYLSRAKAVLADAREEAGSILSAARSEAEALTAQARAQADAVTSEARARADALTTEAAANKARMEEKFAGMSARLQAEMQQITSLMQGIAAQEEEA